MTDDTLKALRALIEDGRRWQKVCASSVRGGSDAQAINFLTMTQQRANGCGRLWPLPMRPIERLLARLWLALLSLLAICGFVLLFFFGVL